MAGCEDKDSTTPPKVTFSGDIPVTSGAAPPRRVELTMKYDRNTVQRRLDIEKWIESELKILYDCTSDQDDDYPLLDLDDVLQFEPDVREQRLREYFKDSKKPIDEFVTELLKKANSVSKALGY